MNAGFGVHITKRWRWLLVIATLSAMTAYWFLQGPGRETTTSSSQTASPNSTARPSATAAAVGAASAPPERGRDTVDLFAPRNWEPPPPVISMPAPPPPPQAPPLPFRLFGRIVDSAQPASFILLRGTEMITVRVGDRIEPAYLVDKFDGTQLHLVYLPLNIRQTLFVGNANE